ncbi:MAG: hypothetical protein HWN66_17470 [Candidatus Helarchaeota archaeon]|nr:hypothetical protein [Candidatus Helarchaeota archaeon]
MFRDETKLEADYVPVELPHRDAAIQRLTQLFKSLVENPGDASKMVIITGPTGAGKTAVTKRVGAMIQELAEQNSIYLRYVHINLRQYNTSFMVLNRIIQHFKPKFPYGELNLTGLVDILSNEILAKEDAYMLLCLDEVNVQSERNLLSEPSLIYNLTGMHEDSPRQRLSLIFIARSESDPSVCSTLHPQYSMIRFAKYSRPQLRDILNKRAGEAFLEGTVLNDTIDVILDFAAESGDARYALELLRLAGKCADDAESPRITPECVRQAKASLDPKPIDPREVIRDLGLHPKLVLLAIIRQLKKTQKAYVLLGEVEAPYRLICEEYSTESHSIKPHGHIEVWEYIRDLRDLYNILSIEDAPGQKFTTWLRLKVPIEFIERELEDESKGGFKLS